MHDSDEPPSDDDKLNAAALLLLEFLHKIKPVWNEALTKEICKDPEHASNPHLRYDQNLKRLRDFESLLSCGDVWATSPYISDRAYRLAGMTPGPLRERVTATSLGEKQFNALNPGEPAAGRPGAGSCIAATPESCIMDQRRFVTGGEHFGLLTKRDERPNYKPVDAEQRLHEVMISAMRPLVGLLLGTASEVVSGMQAGIQPDNQNDPSGQNDPTGGSGSGGREGS